MGIAFVGGERCRAACAALCAFFAVACQPVSENGDSGGGGDLPEGEARDAPPLTPLPVPDVPLISCFARGTPIATPAGDVPIEQIRIGDEVLAYSFPQQRVVSSIVTDFIEHRERPVLRLGTSAGPALQVTPEHPVYVVDAGRFRPAAEATVGTRLLALISPGAAAPAAVEIRDEVALQAATVYDLTVDSFHNYFAAGVLVHNKPRCWTDATGCMVCVGANPYGPCRAQPFPVGPSVATETPDEDAGAGYRADDDASTAPDPGE
jgi:Pretoxin HINT domain